MSDNHTATCDSDTLLDDFAAELTNAAYPLALRHGIRGSWIKLELGLWRALAETVENWGPGRPPAGLPDEVEAWREGLLADLTNSALYVAAKHGIKGSLLQVELALNQTFRPVIRRNCGRQLTQERNA